MEMINKLNYYINNILLNAYNSKIKLIKPVVLNKNISLMF